jgi:hypothetical protein
MLHDTAKFYVVKSMDRYQAKTYDEYTVKHVHLQNAIDTIKGPDNTEVQLKAILFVDCKKSTPCYDLYQMQCDSLKAGDTMRVEIKDAYGEVVDNFAVIKVDGIPDVPADRTHHWELSLI